MFHAVAVTSGNAMRAAERMEELVRLFPLPVFAVGARTAEAVTAAGFEKVTYSTGDATELAKIIRQSLPSGTHILHLSGEHRAQEFSALLSPANIEVMALVLYRMRAAANFSPTAVSALKDGRIEAVLHYSPRTAAVFVTLMQRAGLAGKIRDLRHFCLSEAVAAPLLAAGARPQAAAKPDENTLLSMI